MEIRRHIKRTHVGSNIATGYRERVVVTTTMFVFIYDLFDTETKDQQVIVGRKAACLGIGLDFETDWTRNGLFVQHNVGGQGCIRVGTPRVGHVLVFDKGSRLVFVQQGKGRSGGTAGVDLDLQGFAGLDVNRF